MIVVARVLAHLSQSTCLEMLHPKTDNTCEPQCGGAPSCWKILETNLSNGKKYICIPRSFLVINVCNQVKTLCSLCIFGSYHQNSGYCHNKKPIKLWRSSHIWEHFTSECFVFMSLKNTDIKIYKTVIFTYAYEIWFLILTEFLYIQYSEEYLDI